MKSLKIGADDRHVCLSINKRLLIKGDTSLSKTLEFESAILPDDSNQNNINKNIIDFKNSDF